MAPHGTFRGAGWLSCQSGAGRSDDGAVAVVTNSEVAALFEELALLTRIKDGSAQSFRARAYEAAAKTLEGLPQRVAELSGVELRGLSGIGKSSAAYIREYVESGRVAKLDRLREEYPPEFRELVRVPGLGPKRAVVLRRVLGVDSVASLIAALEAEAIRELPGFGPKTEENLRRAIDRLGWSGKDRRTPILAAMRHARRIVTDIGRLPGVEDATYCGSLRRFRDTVADLDILVATSDPAQVAERLVKMGWISQVIGSGGTKTSVLTPFGSAGRCTDGARDGSGVRPSCTSPVPRSTTSAYGGWPSSGAGCSTSTRCHEADGGAVVAQETEHEIYEALGLPWIPPTIREDRGEIEAAQAHALPDLVADGDLRGDLHVHTDMSGDGDDPLEAMLDRASALGLEYIAITDHAENLAINGVGRPEMLAQRRRIASLQRSYPAMRILHGVELNIGKDGSLDYDHDFLMDYDWCVASVHSYFDLPADHQTARLVRAIRHPAVDVIGHLQGRRIGRRPGIELDPGTVLEAAESTGTAIEINSHLDRLDATVEVLFRSRGRRVHFVISTDAHRTSELEQSRWGIRQAQRGWIERDRVANTWPLARFLEWSRGVPLRPVAAALLAMCTGEDPDAAMNSPINSRHSSGDSIMGMCPTSTSGR